MTVSQEGDILGACLANLRRQGITAIYAALGPSDDKTEDILGGYRAHVLHDDPPAHFYPDHQPYLMGRLADIAHADGHEWMLPVDADEFPYAPGGRITPALADCTAQKVYIERWIHRDRYYRRREAERLGKVAWRYAPDTLPEVGNHDIALDPGAHDLLALREIPYRSAEQFRRKVRRACAVTDPASEANGHMLPMDGMSDEQLEHRYAQFCAECAVYDPIP
jgi:Glycosyl transferase family 2